MQNPDPDKSFVTRIALLTFAAVPITMLVLGGKAPQTASQASALIQRGEYLVAAGGCSHCHTPKRIAAGGLADDPDRFLSGHPENAQLPAPPSQLEEPWSVTTAGFTAWSGAWGVSYASNLTPDSSTGLGIWTEEMFLKAMRTGKHYGASRDILPPMPWQSLSRLSDDDLRAVFAYLRSIRPVRNQVPDPIPPGGHPELD